MTNLAFHLLPWQIKVWSSKARFRVIAAGRRCGKSNYVIKRLILKGLQAPKGSSILYVAPTLGQARQIAWSALTEDHREVVKSAHINSQDITLVNGVKIHVRGADNPDTLRGLKLFYAALDEAAFIKEDVWSKIIRPALSDLKGEADFISTPSGRNWFYDAYKLGLSGEDAEWASWHFTTYDNPTIDPKEIDSAKRNLSSHAFNQEFMSSFDNQGSEIFKEEWIKYGKEPQYGEYIIAIDLAGFEDVGKQNTSAVKQRLDETAIAVVKQCDDGSWWVKDILHGRWDVKATASKILRVIQDNKPIAVGIEKGALKNAVSPYLHDLMRQYSTYAHLTDLTHGNRKKQDRIAWSLQGRFEHGRITLNEDKDWSDFKEQLTMFPTAGIHDDLVDALSYVDQLAIANYVQESDNEEWEPISTIIGY
jgi:phage terminase large subunit-like protein